MRWNCVGTMWVWVTRYCSILASVSSGSHLSMKTTVWPEFRALPANVVTAVW